MKIFKNKIDKDICINIIYFVLILIYFIVLRVQILPLDENIVNQYISVSGLEFAIIAIFLFEIGYNRKYDKKFVEGIEFLSLGILTILIKYIAKRVDNPIEEYINIMIFGFLVYYIIKSLIQVMKYNSDKLDKYSDIKEIVKNEPVKKETRRKNIKKEEGK